MITGAAPSPRAQYNYRRLRYGVTMAIRVACLILMAAFYRTIWLWPVFAAGAIVLPWIAVILANDQLPAKPSRIQRYLHLDRRRDVGSEPVRTLAANQRDPGAHRQQA